MKIERTSDEIVIRLSASIGMDELRELSNYLRFREILSDVSVNQAQVDKLASDVNRSYWKKNRDRLLG